MMLAKLVLVGSLMGLVTMASADAAQPKLVKSSHAYGKNGRQVIDLVRPEKASGSPVILFIHGGGWTSGAKSMAKDTQASHFAGQGFTWAAMNYRLVPGASVEDQARDVASAVRWLRRKSESLGLDPSGVVLLGHSSGGHLAALVASDPRWLKEVGLSHDVIRGVVMLDAAAIDVPAMMASGAATSPHYQAAFGKEPVRQKSLSPRAHVGPPDAARWLILYDRYHNKMTGNFSEQIAGALNESGAEARAVGIPETTHMGMLNNLGRPGDATTREVNQFLSGLLRDAKAGPAASPTATKAAPQ